jgi:hypothetical protein
MAPREAVKMCLCGTLGGFFVGQHATYSLWDSLLSPSFAQFVDVAQSLVASIFLLRAIWWMILTVGAIGRASESATHN